MNIKQRDGQFLAFTESIQPKREMTVDEWLDREFRWLDRMEKRGGKKRPHDAEQADHQFDHDRAKLDQEDWDSEVGK